MLTDAALLLGFVTLQRLGELILARRNTRALLQQGGIEAGRAHYPAMVAMHAAWLAGLWVLAYDHPVDRLLLGLLALLQAGRLWVMASLGRRWTTRIIVAPGEALVRRGPYRFLKHPNYWIVAGEIAAVPLALGLPAYAAAFTALNAVILWVRIRAEEAALNAAGQG